MAQLMAPGPECRPEPLRRALTLPRKRPAPFLFIAWRLFGVGPIVRLSDMSEQIGNFRQLASDSEGTMAINRISARTRNHGSYYSEIETTGAGDCILKRLTMDREEVEYIESLCHESITGCSNYATPRPRGGIQLPAFAHWRLAAKDRDQQRGEAEAFGVLIPAQ